jgi:EmrB/QacA subfamily drug resistance transporter
MRRTPLWLAVLAAGVPMFMATLDNLVVTTALPAIHADLGADIEGLQWITNAYTLAFASLMLFAVGLGDRFGRRRVFVIGITVFALASAACALAADETFLVIARAVQGAGAAATMPLSLPLLVTAVPDRLRAAAIGIWGGIAGLGVALGPVVGGAVVDGWSWSAIFWLNVPVAVLAIPLALLALPESFGARVRTDVAGVVLASLSVVALVLGIVRGNDAGWASAEVLGSLAVGAAALAAFIVWEARSASPLLPLRLFRDRGFTVANAVAMVFSLGAFGAVFLLAQFLQIVQGHSPLEAGLMTLPWTAMPLIVAPLSGLVAPRVGTRALIVAGLTLLAGGVGYLGLILAGDATYAEQLPGYVAAGIGMGLAFSPISNAVLAGIRPEDHAKANGTNSTLREIGVALGIAVLTAVFTGAGGTLTPAGFADAAQPAVLAGAGAVAVGALLALLLPSGRVRREPAELPDGSASTEERLEVVPA